MYCYLLGTTSASSSLLVQSLSLALFSVAEADVSEIEGELSLDLHGGILVEQDAS